MSNALFKRFLPVGGEVFRVQYPSNSIVRYLYQIHGSNYRDELITLCKAEGSKTEYFIEDNLLSLSKLKHAHLKSIKEEYIINHTHIQFVFCLNHEIEASATLNKNIEYINISFGLMFKVYDLCMKIFIANDLFLNIGSPSSSNITSNDLDVFFITNIKGVDANGGKYPDGDCGFFLSDLVPECPNRHDYAKSVYYCILYYVYFHELGHHARGHVQFFKDEFNLDSYSEFNIHERFRSNLEYLKMRRFLEYDADGYALRTLLKMRNTGFNNLFDKYTDKEIIQIIFTATSLINRIFDVEYPKELYSKLTTHPYPSVRSGKVYIEHILSKHFDANSIKMFMEEYVRQESNISQVWKKVGIKEVTFVDSLKIKKQEKELLDNNDELINNLEAFRNKRKKRLRRKVKQNYW